MTRELGNAMVGRVGGVLEVCVKQLSGQESPHWTKRCLLSKSKSCRQQEKENSEQREQGVQGPWGRPVPGME